MTPRTRAERHDEDLDKADRRDKWQPAVWILALLLVGAVTWILIVQSNTSDKKASSEASQKFTLAQQVAAACAVKEQADDLGGLCASAKQIVKEGPAGKEGLQGPAGDTGPQGPLGPKGEQGVQGIQGVLGSQGIFGKPGTTGIAGEPGPTGPAGPAGADGATGAAGADGSPGGPSGATGADGQSAFPFSFTFTVPSGSYDCTVTSPTTDAECTRTDNVPTP